MATAPDEHKANSPGREDTRRLQEPRDHLFIVGCARTGSTLIQHILNRSPDICLAPETHFMKRARRLDLARRLAAATDMNELRKVVDILYQVDAESGRGGWAWLRRNIPVERFAERLAGLERTERSVFDLVMHLYAEWLKPEAHPRILGEKTPGHLVHVPTLLAWYPGAKVLHTMRDPRAVYASELGRRRQGRWGLKTRLHRVPDAVIDPVLAPAQLIHTALRWRQAARLDREYERALGSTYLRLRFEDLVNDPEGQLGRVTDFLGVRFDPAMLDVRRTGSSYSPSRHSGDGLDPSATDRWRDHIGPIPRAWLRATLGHEMRRYGYTP